MKKEKNLTKLEKQAVEESLGNIPILDPKAIHYRKYLIISCVLYLIYLLIAIVAAIKNGTMNSACLVDTPICFLNMTSIYYRPLIFIIIFSLAILALLNVASLLFEPFIYGTLLLELAMTIFLAFVNIYFVLAFIIIMILKFVYLYYDKKDEKFFGMKI